ncbi:hypothetical protein MUK42_00482 [Musa troglodytarum]|uniref:Uncharacterized protein n=1 Tax=Musa troglodytarum TaxID=320322 RepID=A0A9E7FFL3_9LILI|nr:hypothetical protein MUK42_00482 [Musa troglodytarum]
MLGGEGSICCVYSCVGSLFLGTFISVHRQRKKEKEREKDLGAMEASVHDFSLRSLLQALARHQSLFQGIFIL